MDVTVLLFAVRPRFPPDHITEVYIWAGKTRNITCHILAEPLPVIEWIHLGRSLVNNETYRMYIMSKDTNLQVNVHIVACMVIITLFRGCIQPKLAKLLCHRKFVCGIWLLAGKY